jgi:hypothetical protein
MRAPARPAFVRRAGTRVVSRILHIRFGLSAVGCWLKRSSGDGSSHLLVLQRSDVEVSFGRPRRAGDVAQPGRARLRADCPSGNAPTTRVRRLISRRMRGFRDVLDPPHRDPGQIHLDQFFLDRTLAPPLALDDRRLEGLRPKLRDLQAVKFESCWIFLRGFHPLRALHRGRPWPRIPDRALS